MAFHLSDNFGPLNTFFGEMFKFLFVRKLLIVMGKQIRVISLEKKEGITWSCSQS